MLTIRLSRVGKRKQPIYRFIVSEKSRDPWGKVLAILGNYNPRSTPPLINVKAEEAKLWIARGAQMSDTVWNLFVDLKLVEGEKRKKLKISTRRKEKLAKKS